MGLADELSRGFDAVRFRALGLGAGGRDEYVLERLDLLWLTVLEDFEFLGLQIENGTAGACRVGIDANEVGLAAERWRLLVRLLLGTPGLCDGDSCGPHRESDRSEDATAHRVPLPSTDACGWHP